MGQNVVYISTFDGSGSLVCKPSFHLRSIPEFWQYLLLCCQFYHYIVMSRIGVNSIIQYILHIFEATIPSLSITIFSGLSRNHFHCCYWLHRYNGFIYQKIHPSTSSMNQPLVLRLETPPALVPKRNLTLMDCPFHGARVQVGINKFSACWSRKSSKGWNCKSVVWQIAVISILINPSLPVARHYLHRLKFQGNLHLLMTLYHICTQNLSAGVLSYNIQIWWNEDWSISVSSS